MKGYMFTLVLILLITGSTSAETLLTSGLNAVVSSGTLSISNYPYGVAFPVNNAKWIWNQNWASAPNGQTLTFFAEFRVNCLCKKLTLYTTTDNFFKAYVNGKFVGSGDNWTKVYSFEIPSSFLNQGDNVLEIVGANVSGPAALIYGIVAQ